MYVIKPINGGSSVGVIIVNEQNEIPLSKNFNYDEMMAEAFVGTKELTVTILKNTPLTVTEIKPKKNNEFSLVFTSFCYLFAVHLLRFFL